MNIMSIYSDWGIAGQNDIMISISLRHRKHKTSLQKFHRYLARAYSPNEIPIVLSRYSEILGGSILSFLCDVDGGADYLVDLIEQGGF